MKETESAFMIPHSSREEYQGWILRDEARADSMVDTCKIEVTTKGQSRFKKGT